jgi:hypothetical protein
VISRHLYNEEILPVQMEPKSVCKVDYMTLMNNKTSQSGGYWKSYITFLNNNLNNY